MKKYFFLIIAFFLTACSPQEADFKSDVPESNPSIQDNLQEVDLSAALMEKEDIADQNEVNKEESSLALTADRLPLEVNLTVPFFSQAPEGDWSQPWQDACEESSLILAHYGMKGEAITKTDFKKKVLEMVEWENEHFGYYESTPVEQVVELYKGYFTDAFEVKVIEDPTVDDLKQELAQGHLIVGPFAGRMLGNPFYSGEGPYYHMMVIKGYDETHFITNDVGTRRGENFIYDYQTILDAMHDYKEPGIENQPARVIVLY